MGELIAKLQDKDDDASEVSNLVSAKDVLSINKELSDHSLEESCLFWKELDPRCHWPRFLLLEYCTGSWLVFTLLKHQGLPNFEITIGLASLVPKLHLQGRCLLSVAWTAFRPYMTWVSRPM